jgi:hypothetical protein
VRVRKQLSEMNEIMNNSNQILKRLAQSVTGCRLVRTFGPSLAAIVIICLGVVNTAQSQTSVVCDGAGDTLFGNGKGGPQVPPWLDVVQATITDAGNAIVFSLTLNAPIPAAPSWSGNEEGGQFWWGWRLAGDVSQLTFIKGCVFPNGKSLPAAYFLDLIWSIQTRTFRARVLDDTSCAESAVPFVFSADRTQISTLVPKSFFSNRAIFQDPNKFQYFAGTRIYKANAVGNMSFSEVDNAPDQDGGGFAVGTWSAFENSSYFCQ